jgi:hypothetical protein
VSGFRSLIAASVAIASTLSLADCRAIPDLSGRVGLFEVAEGNTQTIPAGSTAPVPLAVRTFNESREPIPGIEVRWVIASGGGTLSSSASTTDNAGIASVMYTAPAQPGRITVQATVPPELTVHFTLTVVAPAGS